MGMLALAILILSAIAGVIAIFFTTFGTMIIFIGSLLYAAMTDFAFLTVRSLVVLFALYFCGEILEYLFIIMGAKKFGASNAAVVGALVGGIVGAMLGVGFLGIGLIGGAFFGIFAGAFLVEFMIHGDTLKSLKAGTGGVLGRVGSIVVKLIIAVVMLVIIFSNAASSLRM